MAILLVRWINIQSLVRLTVPVMLIQVYIQDPIKSLAKFEYAKYDVVNIAETARFISTQRQYIWKNNEGLS